MANVEKGIASYKMLRNVKAWFKSYVFCLAGYVGIPVNTAPWNIARETRLDIQGLRPQWRWSHLQDRDGQRHGRRL